MTKINEPRFGRRIKQLREKRGATQEMLAQALGISDRQTISELESGRRKINASELHAASKFLGISMEDLANPFLLVSDRVKFSWRQHGVSAADLCRFETRAGEWIGAYRELRSLNGEHLRTLMPRLGLTHTSSFGEAIVAGEAVARELDLGEVPARTLADAVEAKLGILVLMVDAIVGVSGAACRLPELNTILINRNDTAARRNYDLAHELFHILTWDTMPPARIDSDEGFAGMKAVDIKRLKKIEVLAQNFASGLLIPSKYLDTLTAPRSNAAEWLSAAADHLGVSGQALKYRMQNAYRPVCEVEDFDLLKAARCRGTEPSLPPLYSKTFIGTISAAISGGHLSGRRAAMLLDLTTDDLGDLCDAYSIERPAEL